MRGAANIGGIRQGASRRLREIELLPRIPFCRVPAIQHPGSRPLPIAASGVFVSVRSKNVARWLLQLVSCGFRHRTMASPTPTISKNIATGTRYVYLTSIDARTPINKLTAKRAASRRKQAMSGGTAAIISNIKIP